MFILIDLKHFLLVSSNVRLGFFLFLSFDQALAHLS